MSSIAVHLELINLDLFQVLPEMIIWVKYLSKL